VEAKVHSTGCAPVGIPVVLPLEVYSDAFTAPVTGDATVGIPPDSLTLFAKAQTTPGFRGQAIDVAQDDGDPTTVDTGYVNGTKITGYAGTHTFNSANNMMVGWMEVNAMSINWEPNQFIGYVIKDFYMGQDAIGNSQAIPPVLPDTHIVYDWGLQFLSKAGYPVEKYWQRSKVRRSDGGQGYTAFVKDRLVGVTKCRIAVVLQGFNEVGLFWQSGTLTISAAAPGDAVPEFTAIPNI
ncbi:MAG TPA: hypothetical protein PLZ16_08775, partial [Gammaproteobacteria bacterium]|nr:hypothetical protein [Gammaproteobacteria bacterium]